MLKIRNNVFSHTNFRHRKSALFRNFPSFEDAFDFDTRSHLTSNDIPTQYYQIIETLILIITFLRGSHDTRR